MKRWPVAIVSGGQTGVDRGALDAALELGAECGGWCPQGRKAEDGPIPERYPLRELAGAEYADRTRRNVADSDGTLVITWIKPGRGTDLTMRHARELEKPLLRIDAGSTKPGQAIERVRAFIEGHRIRVLNVAGPRASGAAEAHAYSQALIRGVLQS